MRYCVNPNCSNPENPDSVEICQNCHSGLLLCERFLPIEMIAQGGFGRIFKAIDLHSFHRTKCLIKQFYPDQNSSNNNPINRNRQTLKIVNESNDDLEKIHQQEIASLAKLKHPQIPVFITNFEQDGYLYLVQEFIEGQNLKTELEKQGAFSEDQIWQVIDELLPVIKYIHEENIIHRDIKPENIMRSSQKKMLVLVDFGAAKLISPKARSITRKITGTIIGTPDFMAPEQQNGREVFASDLYSLGVTCICLLTNKEPSQLFDDGSHSWKWKDYASKVSNKLEFVLNKLIELGTSNRYASTDELLKDVNKFARIFKGIKKQKSNHTNWEKAGIIGTILAGVATAFGLFLNTQDTPGNTENPNPSQAEQVENSSQPEDNYNKLRNYLETKNWQSADKETYEIILKMSGKKAESRGYISYDELQNLSCVDLKTMDDIWRISSDGKLGFSSQQRIYEESGLNWQKMYVKVGWGKLENSQLINTVESKLDWETRRRVYKIDKTPNFSNPSAGHLPITKDIVRGVAFPQFAEICQF